MGVHEPVLRAEVVSALAPERGGTFVDCTVGLGGHARALLEAGASRLVGLDRDAEALALAWQALAAWAERVSLVHADFRRLDHVLAEAGLDEVAGILADLGMSSFQLEAEGRGFSFQRDAPLDMRMDRSEGPTVSELLHRTTDEALADVIYRFGEERYSRRIARAVGEAHRGGELRTTRQLADVVRRAMGRRGGGRIDPATRTFQALRIWTNRELDDLDVFLVAAGRHLAPGGRLAVITFHSLEDRIVKHAFRAIEQDPAGMFVVVTRKPVTASESEVARNPRSRSAKLRIIERQRT